MKNLYIFILLLISIFSFSQVQVKGYYRKNGTYVRPHVRTAPNSTVTDNYSYQSNNYSSNRTSSTPSTYNYYNSSTNSNSEKIWVNGYYRKDGTYVSGYYRNRNKPTSNNYSSSNSNTAKKYTSNNYTGTKKYINTTKVNFRRTPDLSDNIIGELEYNDEIISISTLGYWENVNVKRYDSETKSYVTFNGYINSRYLSNFSQPTIDINNFETTNVVKNSKNFTVISNKTYFHSTPDIKNEKTAYLVYGEKIYGIAESKYFVYTEFVNSSGIKTVGWILKDDLLKD
ncbi:hypothetical protein [Chryseobacterium sp. MP_3.2]|uniref:hypothetical protein n=1 Tax=Chryseobacterium sp. MP_3.2 TaxID=3071712 RepID=UPI002DFB9503|nr:hypothetical protein [Chryseobacterium sp. MP_3.2]